MQNRCPDTLVVFITPPPVDPHGRREFARYKSFGFSYFLLLDALKLQFGSSVAKIFFIWHKASKSPDRTNEVTGIYAEQCVTLAKELGLPSINLWAKMQEIDSWQKKFLSDGLHLTPEGNEVFQEGNNVFDEAGLSDLPFDFPPTYIN
ncbi:hypothetical protein BUALT_Bualt07G0030300 [Buddleja alternifolia]|uniref:Uncharacterized protein n=1 Tax=Buddleja alternifolia TaxID=168488 RepID=A0AAV6XEG9_9LAMI|nr:hypothetical protein BUALT_Bualt07G0030300 [Buddleja alternifolia]